MPTPLSRTESYADDGELRLIFELVIDELTYSKLGPFVCIIVLFIFVFKQKSIIGSVDCGIIFFIKIFTYKFSLYLGL